MIIIITTTASKKAKLYKNDNNTHREKHTGKDRDSDWDRY